MVELEEQNYNENQKKFKEIKQKLEDEINKNIEIIHVGSTSIPSIKYGKNIIDILIGAKDKKEFAEIAKILESINYIPSDKSKTEEYQFFSSTKEETKSGDIHIHLVLKDTNKYKEFILLKQYLLENKKEAIAYSNFKQKLIAEKINDRKEYKRLKSEYVDKIIEKINKANFLS
jgi:glutamate-rich protein grpB